MSRELLKNHPTITKYTTIYMDTLRDGKSQLVNTNKMVRNYDGCTGLKTGSTSQALFNLSASATKNGLSLIAVVMKGSTSAVRFSEAKKLLDYGFSNFEYKELVKKGDEIGTVSINKGIIDSTKAIANSDFGYIMKKSNDEANVEVVVDLYNGISAPINNGDKIGEVKYILNGNKIGTVDLISNEVIEKTNFGTILNKVYESWFKMLREKEK